MISWTLFVILQGGLASQHSTPATGVVPGFTTHAACVDAGNFIVADWAKRSGENGISYCIRVGGKS
jgi:hypothetical protein